MGDSQYHKLKKIPILDKEYVVKTISSPYSKTSTDETIDSVNQKITLIRFVSALISKKVSFDWYPDLLDAAKASFAETVKDNALLTEPLPLYHLLLPVLIQSLCTHLASLCLLSHITPPPALDTSCYVLADLFESSAPLDNFYFNSNTIYSKASHAYTLFIGPSMRSVFSFFCYCFIHFTFLIHSSLLLPFSS